MVKTALRVIETGDIRLGQKPPYSPAVGYFRLCPRADIACADRKGRREFAEPQCFSASVGELFDRVVPHLGLSGGV